MAKAPGMKRISLDIWDDEISALTSVLHFGARSHLMRALLKEISKKITTDGSSAFIFQWLNGNDPLVLPPLKGETNVPVD